MNALEELKERIAQSSARFGAYTSSHEALGVITEEFYELVTVIRGNYRWSVYEEALDLAACALKLAQDCEKESFKKRSTK
jgi:NTP pyrophosphatase (non-canonical NTP hydrolase)